MAVDGDGGNGGGGGVLQITSNSSLKQHFSTFLRVYIDLCMHPSRRGVDSRNVSISSSSKMVPVLATEGELRQTETCARCRQCVEATGAGAGAFIDGKWSNDGAIGRGSNILPYRSAI
jgi:predicted nucleic acid binding AN1-type Zn finger protein